MADLNIYQRLLAVQQTAKAPRSIDGKFGKSRSAEQILEAYKPVCNDNGLYLYTTDSIVQVGDRNYVTATATVIDVVGGETLTASASAQEGEVPKSKYGADIIDTSQLTGKTSSYAKKYALQNLFAIDDTKDADQDPKKEESEEDVLKRAKKTINAELVAQGYTEAQSKIVFITSVLEKATIDDLNDCDLVMDALENLK